VTAGGWRAPAKATGLALTLALALDFGAGAAAAASGPGASPILQPPELSNARREADERRRTFEPQGAYVGATRVDLDATLEVGYDDNVHGAPQAAQGAVVTSATVRGRLTAGTDAYRLSAGAAAGTTHYAGQASLDHPQGETWLTLDLEGWERSRLGLRLNWERRYEMPGDPTLPGAAGAPVPLDVWRGGGNLLLRRGLWLAGVEGTLSRLNYYDSSRRDGGALDQDDRDRWESDTALRAGIGPLADLDVYLAVEENLRLYDRPSAPLGLVRDSAATTRWAGVRLDRPERLIVDAAIGRTMRLHASPWFDPVRRIVWRAVATWAPTPLTTLSGALWRRLDETAATAYSAVVVRGWQAEIAHEVLRNLTLRGRWRTGHQEYEGPAPPRQERRRHLAVAAEWRLNGRWGVEVDLGWWRTDSSFDIFDMERRRTVLRLSAAL
jgi:hypothetical protein